jgi:hypothetical protein
VSVREFSEGTKTKGPRLQVVVDRKTDRKRAGVEKGLAFFPLHTLLEQVPIINNNLTVQTVRQLKWIEKMCKGPDENFFALCLNLFLNFKFLS